MLPYFGRSFQEHKEYKELGLLVSSSSTTFFNIFKFRYSNDWQFAQHLEYYSSSFVKIPLIPISLSTWCQDEQLQTGMKVGAIV